MDLVEGKDYIFQFKNVLTSQQCADVVAMFEASDKVKPGRVLHSDEGHAYNQDKISQDLEVLPEGPSEQSYTVVHSAISELLQVLIPSLPSLQVYPLQGTGYKIQKYPRNEGKFNWHFDALGPHTQNRLLALILYLNDVQEGGQTEFYYQRRKVKPQAGQAILFPTAWTHMHCGHIPVSNDKYVISSFFYYAM